MVDYREAIFIKLDESLIFWQNLSKNAPFDTSFI